MNLRKSLDTTHYTIAILTNLLVFRIIGIEKRCCQSVSPKGNLK